jgi:hypothetical protein
MKQLRVSAAQKHSHIPFAAQACSALGSGGLRARDVAEPDPLLGPGGKHQHIVAEQSRVQCLLKLLAGELDLPNLVVVPGSLQVRLSVVRPQGRRWVMRRRRGRLFQRSDRRLFGCNRWRCLLLLTWRGLCRTDRRGHWFGRAATPETGERHPFMRAGREYERSFVEVPGVESLLKLLACSGSHLTICELYLP